MTLRLFSGLAILLSLSVGAAAVEPVLMSPNSHDLYKQLRQAGLGSEAVSLSNFQLKRDAGTFTLNGTMCFVQPVNGKVTGAVFTGTGSFTMTPPTPGERKQLSYLTKEEKITEDFSELVLRFTDSTYDELKKAGAATQATCPASSLNDANDAHRKKLRYNLTARMLQDVINDTGKGIFWAFIKGKKYNGKMLFAIDPHGLRDVGLPLAPEEVALVTYDDEKFGVWASFHLAEEHAKGIAVSTEYDRWYDITAQDIDVTLEKSGKLAGKASTSFIVEKDGMQVVPLVLYPSLRVEGVSSADGKALHYVQEDKEQDADYFVILAKPAKKGETVTVTTLYSGKDALLNTGAGNYMLSPGARERWYPSAGFEDYSAYTMKFRYPKDLTLVASGVPVGEQKQDNQKIAEWKSQAPQVVAAFQLGRFKNVQKQVKNAAGDLHVEAFANEEIPDDIRGMLYKAEQQGAVTMSSIFNTTNMLNKALAELELATGLYTDYFGPMPYKRLAITQQTASNFGQAWPGLIWLPITYFFDQTAMNEITGGRDFGSSEFFKMVASHEIAHQWFGHAVTWASYRDQWMSEGFSDLAASIYIQTIQNKNAEFIKFWSDERRMIIERNKEGYRPIDVGPVTMGYRLMNSKTGFDIPRRLIYPKGAYILHMLRMMMWNPKTGDENFKAVMRDFIGANYNKPVSTEAFKAALEKHLPNNMDLDGNRRLDWFFNSYVYGTALPDYKFSYTTDGGKLKMRLTQGNVDANFKMLVPVYVEWGNGKIARLGLMPMTGNETKEQEIPLGNERPKRLMINYFNDVLATIDGK